MTGGSLGLRTGSYGSLQQHLQNSVALPIQSTPGSGRKNSKMLLQGAREKEKLLPRLKILQIICKIARRKEFGMLFLVIASCAVLVLISLAFSGGKDGDVTQLYKYRISTSTFQKPSPIPEKDGRNTIIQSESKKQPITAGNESQPHPTVISLSSFPLRHPCENFSLPPPPADRKRTGPRPCPVCYAPVELAIALMPASPSVSPILKNLTYVSEESSIANESNGGSAFGGHPTLQQRNDSFVIKESMTVHCGFVKGNRLGNGTGFDIDGADLLEMEQCHGVVVASAIFGNYDIIQQPKNISEAAKRSVCFYMFVDEETEAYMKNSSTLDSTNRVGLWRVVVVRNLPYVDARRNGKTNLRRVHGVPTSNKTTTNLRREHGVPTSNKTTVPKLLLHRIFPNARFSLWIDGKLELVVDPYQILERFLWRKNASFAISRHYRRFDVFEEAEANKAAGKYDNASIDNQIEFYKNEGLSHYSSAKLPITSDVPEGCVIIREHTPITNLFTCLWFNEIDRFTSRDQLSFSTVRDKIMSKVNWSIEMFMDCERRNFVVQVYHRDVLEHMTIPAASVITPSGHPPPPVLTNESPLLEIVADRGARTPVKKPPARRGRERKSGSRRHRARVVNGRDNNSI